MATEIALLRGINVGGHNLVSMSDLRELCTSLGFMSARSILQSGNLVFESERSGGADLERLLEAETAKRLGVSADYVVRTAPEWSKIVARNPFRDEAMSDPGRLLVMFLKSRPPAKNVAVLQAANKGPEVIRSDGKQLYLVYPNGVGRSKLTGALIEQKLGIRGTARNWNTVLKLLALCK